MWHLVDQPYYAIGSGMNFAMGSMAAGSSAYEAVKYASKLCPNTGMGITKIDL
jgi:ATP-dependent protease HslVU (ClpYQ) peptidase subunit